MNHPELSRERWIDVSAGFGPRMGGRAWRLVLKGWDLPRRLVGFGENILGKTPPPTSEEGDSSHGYFGVCWSGIPISLPGSPLVFRSNPKSTRRLEAGFARLLDGHPRRARGPSIQGESENQPKGIPNGPGIPSGTRPKPPWSLQ